MELSPFADPPPRWWASEISNQSIPIVWCGQRRDLYCPILGVALRRSEVGHRVSARSAGEAVGTGPAGHRVVTRSAVEDVVTDPAIKGVITTPAEDVIVAVPTNEVVVAVASVDRVVTEAAIDGATAVAAADQVVTSAGGNRIVAGAAEDHVGAHSGGADVDYLRFIGADDDSHVDRARECSVVHRDGEIRERDRTLRYSFDPHRTVGPAAPEGYVGERHHCSVRRGGAQDEAAGRRLHVPNDEVHRANHVAVALAIADRDSGRAVVVVQDGTRRRSGRADGVTRACGHRQDHRLVGLQIRIP